MHRRSALPGRWVRIGAAVRPPPPHAFAARWGNRRHLSTMFGSRKLFKKAEECAAYASEVVRMGGHPRLSVLHGLCIANTVHHLSTHQPRGLPLRAASPWSQSCARPLLLVGCLGKDCPVGCVPCARASGVADFDLNLAVYVLLHSQLAPTHRTKLEHFQNNWMKVTGHIVDRSIGIPRPPPAPAWVAALSAPCVPAPGFGGKCRLRVLRSAPTHISLSHPTT